MIRKITLLIMLSISVFAMHSAEININDTDLEVSAKLDLGQFDYSIEPDTTFLGLRVVNGDDTHGPKKGYENDPYYEINFLMRRAIAQSGVSLGMGVKANYTTDFSALSLGLEASYKILVDNFLPMYLNGNFYYGPKVLSFEGAERYYEYCLNYDVEIIKNGRVTLGYRSMHTDYEYIRGDYIYNQALYFGFKFLF